LYFVTVAEEKHFRRAAERLHISQPPLTQRIQSMERDLGVQLFKRSGRQVELTEAGRMVLAEAQAVLGQIERLREVARAAEHGETGNVRIGLTTSVPFIPAFTRATKAFQHDYPAVVLHLTPTISSRAIDDLRQRKIDICLVRQVAIPVGMRQMPVARDELMLVLPSGHPKANAERIALEEVADERFILYHGEQRNALHAHIMDVWARTGLTPRITQQAETGLAILSLVAAGFGIAILPSSISAIRIDDIVWKHIDMDNRFTASTVVMMYRTEAEEDRIQSRFIEYIRGYAKDVLARSNTSPGAVAEADAVLRKKLY
jgi:DNA-binding transcriptional LysR family regulator